MDFFKQRIMKIRTRYRRIGAAVFLFGVCAFLASLPNNDMQAGYRFFSLILTGLAVYLFIKPRMILQNCIAQAQALGDVETIGQTLAGIQPSLYARGDLRCGEGMLFYQGRKTVRIVPLSQILSAEVRAFEETDSDNCSTGEYRHFVRVTLTSGEKFRIQPKDDLSDWDAEHICALLGK